jgi:cytochrome d ubiquinol oxidase subunit II
MDFRIRPWGFVFPVVTIAGLIGIKWFLHAREDAMVFCSSCAYLIGMLTSVTFSLYPSVLPASTNPLYALTVSNSKAADYGLKIGLVWWLIGMALASGYTVFTYRSFAGKIRATEAGKHERY